MAAQLTEAEERTVQRLFAELITSSASLKGPAQSTIFAGRAPRIIFHTMARLGAADAAATMLLIRCAPCLGVLNLLTSEAETLAPLGTDTIERLRRAELEELRCYAEAWALLCRSVMQVEPAVVLRACNPDFAAEYTKTIAALATMVFADDDERVADAYQDMHIVWLQALKDPAIEWLEAILTGQQRGKAA